MIALKWLFPGTSREQINYVVYIYESVRKVIHRFHVITKPHSDTFSKSAISVLKIPNFPTKIHSKGAYIKYTHRPGGRGSLKCMQNSAWGRGA